MTLRPNRLLAAVLAAGIFAVPLTAAAQNENLPANNGGAIDIRLFRPAVDSKGLFSVNSSDIMPHLDISIALMLDWGHGIFDTQSRHAEPGLDMIPGTADDIITHPRNDLVSDSINVNLGFNLGLFNFMALGFTLPIVILSGPAVDGVSGWEGATTVGGTRAANYGSWSAQHVGDLEIHGKFRFLRAERYPVGLGAVVQIITPTGQVGRGMGSEPGMGLSLQAIVDSLPADWVRLSLNVGTRILIGGTDTSDDINGDTPLVVTDELGTVGYSNYLFTYGIGASFVLVPERLNAILEFYGNMAFSDEDNLDWARQSPMELIAGLKIFLERNSYLYLGGGTGYFTGDPNGYSAADARLVGAWIFEPSIGDRDRDGIKDDVDQCPDDPEDQDDFEDLDGCPDPDNDRDGLLDVEDQCPLIPEDRDGDADEDGCPEGEQGDRDGDTILDVNDSCPDDPEDKDGYQDVEGCPDPDNDNDTIRDIDDLCPNEPEDHDNFNDVEGCPDVDNDQDRILDVDDECPNEPETYNGTEDEDGCPDQGRVMVTGTDVVIMDKIYFETDSAQIMPVSFDILNAVAATLNNQPQIRLIEVQGHADERNNDEYNIQLTRDRANAVVEYLVRQGVDPRRLISSGFGERCAIDPGHNERAWDKNRRVEFKIIWTDAGPTNVERSCPAGAELQAPIPADFQR